MNLLAKRARAAARYLTRRARSALGMTAALAVGIVIVFDLVGILHGSASRHALGWPFASYSRGWVLHAHCYTAL